MTRMPLSRKRLAQFGAGAALVVTLAGSVLGPAALAQTLPLQPAPVQVTAPSQTASALTVGETQPLTPAVTEGPYFKANSPETTNLVQDGMQGKVITITGQVLDQQGNPVAGALLDFWQANANGQYDNTGYTLRGHQYADENGYYTLTTVVPGLYPGRTEHIHVKVQAPGSSVLTTQLFFPDAAAQNARDSIYDPSLLLNVTTNPDGIESATFNFVVPTA